MAKHTKSWQYFLLCCILLLFLHTHKQKHYKGCVCGRKLPGAICSCLNYSRVVASFALTLQVSRTPVVSYNILHINGYQYILELRAPTVNTHAFWWYLTLLPVRCENRAFVTRVLENYSVNNDLQPCMSNLPYVNNSPLWRWCLLDSFLRGLCSEVAKIPNPAWRALGQV